MCEAVNQCATPRTPGIYGVLLELKSQGPVLMEAEAKGSSYENARAAVERWVKDPRIIRAAVVRLHFEHGNDLLISDMERLQNV